MNRGLVHGVVLGTLALWAGTASAQTPNTGLPWTSTFDAGNTSEWNGGATSGLQIVTSGCLSGSCARGVLTAGTTSSHYADQYFGDFYTINRAKVEEVWLRFSSKFDAGYGWADRSHKMAIINLTDGAGARRYQVYVYVNPSGQYAADYSYIDTWQFFGLGQNRGTVLSPRFGQWDKIKLYSRLNTPGQSNGIVRMWVNDELKLEYTNLNIRQGTSYGFNKLILSSIATTTSRTDGVQYWDSWTLSTTDPDGGTPPPPTAPAAPSNLRIVTP